MQGRTESCKSHSGFTFQNTAAAAMLKSTTPAAVCKWTVGTVCGELPSGDDDASEFCLMGAPNVIQATQEMRISKVCRMVLRKVIVPIERYDK